MIGLLVIPAVAFGLLWLNVATRRSSLGFSRLSMRGAFVLAFLLFELVVLAVTEVASIGRNLTSGVVTTAWCMVAVVLAAGAWGRIGSPAAISQNVRAASRRLRESLASLGIADRLGVGVLVAIFGILAVVGLEYLPSNSDSLVYHLARVEHWIQNRTVAPFATHYLPQVEFPPLGEYNLALLHLLGGTDRVDAVVALLSFTVCIVGLSELARLFGAPPTVQIQAALIGATIPTGVLLATSTENDCFAAAVGIGILVILAAFPADGLRWRAAAIIGLSVGLAYLSKTTVLVMLAPAGAVLAVLVVYRAKRTTDRGRRALGVLGAVGMAGACALVVVAPFTAREIAVFGTPVGPATSESASSHLTMDAGVANLTRSLANDFAIGNGRSGIEYLVGRTVLHVLHGIFVDTHISPSDARYSNTPSANPFAVADQSTFQRNEARGADPWNVLLVLAAMILLAVAAMRGRRWSRLPLLFGLALIVGWIGFYATARWGPYSARYGLVVLAPCSVVCAMGLGTLPRWVGRVVVAALVVASLPQLVDNYARPLVPAPGANEPALEPYLVLCCGSDAAQTAVAYRRVASVLRQSGCGRAGIANWVEFEYPLWVAVRESGWTGTLDDVDVTNRTAALESTEATCAQFSQVGSGYRTPAAANLQFGDLVVSITPALAPRIRTTMANFSSSAAGVRLFPGEGWVPLVYGVAAVGTRASLYVTSPTARSMTLRMQFAPGLGDTRVVVSDRSGHVLPSVSEHGLTQTAVAVESGVTRLDLAVSSPSRDHRAPFALTEVSIAPADAAKPRS